MISRRLQSSSGRIISPHTSKDVIENTRPLASSPPEIPINMTPVVEPSSPSIKADWWAERYSIILLIALYTAQGLPMGLAFGTIPFLLKEGGSSYGDLAKFSLASLPYSLKLLIAPIVDSIYNPVFGRRKSWIVPVQLLIGAVLLSLSSHIHQWVANGDVALLMPTFFLVITLTATQDIAVDGWSLTMLRRENVAFASTCQSFGLSIGFFATFTIFLAFNNATFCDSYVRPMLPFSRSSGALVDLAFALRVIGIFYIFLTIYITLFKSETSAVSNDKKSDTTSMSDLSPTSEDKSAIDESLPASCSTKSTVSQKILSTYSDMFIALRLPAVQTLIVCLLIAKLGVSAYDSGMFSQFAYFLDQPVWFRFPQALRENLTFVVIFLVVDINILILQSNSDSTKDARFGIFKRKNGVNGCAPNAIYLNRNSPGRSMGCQTFIYTSIFVWVVRSDCIKFNRTGVRSIAKENERRSDACVLHP